uniref:Uncharacterized protein n=1 Tax=Cacopsylla melanoneura TaxID=428564 RepID=A0A8D8Z3R1_9HEMI
MIPNSDYHSPSQTGLVLSSSKKSYESYSSTLRTFFSVASFICFCAFSLRLPNSWVAVLLKEWTKSDSLLRISSAGDRVMLREEAVVVGSSAEVVGTIRTAKIRTPKNITVRRDAIFNKDKKISN